MSTLLPNPLEYPFGIPRASFALADGMARLTDERCFPGDDLSFSKIVTTFPTFQPRNPIRKPVGVLACGSNASPTRLAEKLNNSACRTAFGLRIPVKGWIPVYAATLSYYGAVPATFEHIVDEDAEPFLVVIDEQSLAPIIESELRSDNYETYHVQAETIGRSADFPIYAFIAGQGALRLDGKLFRVTEFQSARSPFGAACQRDVLESVLGALSAGPTLAEYIEQVSDSAFVLDIRAQIIEIFGSSPHVPAWEKPPPDEVANLLSDTG